MTVIGILEGDARPGAAFPRLPLGVKPPAGFEVPLTTIKTGVPGIVPVTVTSALPSWATIRPGNKWETERRQTIAPPAYKPPTLVRPDTLVPLVQIEPPKPALTLAPPIRPTISVETFKPKEIALVLAPRPTPGISITPPVIPTMEIKPAAPAIVPGAGAPGGIFFDMQCRAMPWLPQCRTRPTRPGSGPFIPPDAPGTNPNAKIPPSIVTPGHNIPPTLPPVNIPTPTMTIPPPGPAEEAAAEAETGGMKWLFPVGAAVLAYFVLEGK